jgi:sporulation protein YlmC with PRC-barrel domain
MKPTEVRFEDLLGRTVRNSYGRPIGRIEDARVVPDGDEYRVIAFLLGPLGRWHRLLAFAGEVPTLRALGIGKQRRVRPVPWHWIDLTNPEQPRLVDSEVQA